MESDNTSFNLGHPHKEFDGTKPNMLSHSLQTVSSKEAISTSPDIDSQNQIYLDLTKIVDHILFTEWDPIGVHLLTDFDCRDEYQTYTPTIVGMVIAGATLAEISDHLMVFEGYIKGDDKSIRRRCDVIAVLVARYGPHYSQYPFTPKIDTATPDAAYQSVLDLVTQTRLDAYDNQWEAVRTGYEQAVAICQTQLDGRDPLLAACLNNLAQAYTELGQLERAQSFLERAVPLLAAHEEADEASYLRCLGNLIRNLEHCRQFSEAQPYLKAMLACLERTAIDDDDQRILDVRSRIERPTLNESSAAKLRCARLDVEGDGFGQIMNIVMLE